MASIIYNKHNYYKCTRELRLKREFAICPLKLLKLKSLKIQITVSQDEMINFIFAFQVPVVMLVTFELRDHILAWKLTVRTNSDIR